MKKELKMRHIFIPVLVVVIILGIIAAVISNSDDNTVTPTDGEAVYHVHEDGETHYGAEH